MPTAASSFWVKSGEPMQGWLDTLSIASLIISFLCCVFIAADIFHGHSQQMWIMNVVWPVTALYSGPIGLFAYFKIGRLSSNESYRQAEIQGTRPPGITKPFWQVVAVGTMHCGSGCTLGDICSEWLLFFVPFTIAGKMIFGAWIVDYIFAYIFGIAFQYYAIKPMRDYSVGQALAAATKADTFSLTAWQIGMYAWMAIATFFIFGHELEATSPAFWFMMQIGMLLGFLTSYPVNWWLIRRGTKEAM